ncbi:hypothetical protein EVAR_98520_1 [Eumeta japonica]|uniref:Uncharacterized protein n=1 Tax=Eumeta variegata TaxID=151549 RepID=A0A4C2A1K5_EUMVA|nr:hypothetical protein EVAR_98520_1 [Eumeta japonica]
MEKGKKERKQGQWMYSMMKGNRNKWKDKQDMERGGEIKGLALEEPDESCALVEMEDWRKKLVEQIKEIRS